MYKMAPRDPKRIVPLLALVELYWKDHPDLRLGQVIANMASDIDPFYVEDDVMAVRLKNAICGRP